MENRKRAPSVAAPRHERRWSEAEAAQLLDAWSASGESLAGFARRHGVAPQRLAWWRKRLRRSAVAAMAAPAFLPVVVAAAAAAPRQEARAVAVDVGAVHIELRTLDESSAWWVAALARALGAAS